MPGIQLMRLQLKTDVLLALPNATDKEPVLNMDIAKEPRDHLRGLATDTMRRSRKASVLNPLLTHSTAVATLTEVISVTEQDTAQLKDFAQERQDDLH